MKSFRKKRVLLIICILASSILTNGQEKIDRYKLVNRHNVNLITADPLAPMTVGNGDFAFTADITGFQTFENYYHTNGIPLETMCTWSWHSFPNVNRYKIEDAMKESDFHGRKIKYASIEKSPAGQYFRMNPHPVALGQISLNDSKGSLLQLESISEINQHLNLWSGIITSNFKTSDQQVVVNTVSHPEKSAVSFKIKSALLKNGLLKPAIRFPYSYDLNKNKNKPPFDWSKKENHTSKIISNKKNQIIIQRSIDTTVYFVKITWQGNAKVNNTKSHTFYIENQGSDSLSINFEFTAERPDETAISYTEVADLSSKTWKEFWEKGGVADFSGSTDPRASELERRIILSQYLLKVNYSGHFPPQETGLAHISWFGKHNSEVYWIHAAQFYQFNHTELLENGLSWYNKILPVAQNEAKSKGFDGAMWPKMAGYNGQPTPGGINPFIIWNQPNPIYLCELVYRAKPDNNTLSKYSNIVFETAKFLASYAFYDKNTNRYVLGPPIKSVNESSDENLTQNPSFELVQWYYGLKVAQDWLERCGKKRDPLWDDILLKISRPTIVDGKYLQIETEPDMYNGNGGLPSDMLMALGYLPETPMINKEIMKNTFKEIFTRNRLPSFVSWSMGKGALTAARLGFTKEAVDIVCNDAPKARFNKTGYVPRPKEGIACPAYLPVNSSFMAAVGLMLGGWDGNNQHAPGFPKDGSWVIRYENINKMP